MNSNRIFTKILTLFVAVSFFTQTISPSFSFSQELLLPKPDQFISLSENYSFPLLKGLKFSPQEPLKMEFIIDRGDDKVATQEEAAQLIRYFLAGLTIPEEDLWVNLSPYEEDRIIPEKLAETDLGKDLLSQDYLLKQLSSSLTYPESETGKDYWKEVYQEVYKIAKTTKVPVNTFNKIWIIPDEAEVAESENFALVTKATLKAMLEEDYLALKNKLPEIQSQKKDLQEVTIERINKVASQVMRQQILPQINADVNQGRNFANLRQIYHSLILGVWFKKRFKESIYQHYIGKNKIQGIDIDDKSVKEKIYNLYVQAFKKGLYNYIRTEQEPITRKRIKRQYFSGGLDKRRLGDEVVFVNLSPHQLLEEGETLPDRSVSSAIVGINHFPSEEKIAASPLTAISIPGIGEISTIEEIDFKGKRVVIRVDFNVPIEYDAQGKLKVADPHKIEEALETIRYIQAQNPKYTVLITHFEPKKEGIISTEVIFNELKKLLPREKIIFSRESVIEEGLKEEVIKTISQYKEGEIILLENIRFAKGEKKGCPKLIEQLSSLADIYVVDAFATIHRPHASMLPSTEIKAVGFLVEKEISNLSQGLSPDVAIFGGLKVEDKVAMVESLLEKMQKGGRILIGGAMAYTFLKAKDPEIKLGKSLIEEDKIELAKEILGRAKAKGIEIVLPVDHLVATELSEGAEATTTKSINIPEGKMGVDIGEKTISFFLEKLEGAEIIVWNGPMGAFEKRFGGFINGTKKLLEGINSLKSTKKVIIGGGDINKAVKDVIKKTATTLDENKFFLSTGGGATLGFLAMEESVGKVLRNLTVSSPVSVTDRIDKEEKKYVYYIGGNTNKYTVGGKGAGLSMMYNEGLPVPPAFTIPTWLCPEYLKENKLPEPLIQAIEENLKRLENEMGRKFGDEQNPLLVSVRSGAAVSMPGMMDTILNIGLNDRNVDNFGQNTDPRTAWDSYRRLIQMFGDVVLGIEKTHFEKILNEVKKENNYTSDTQLKVEDLKNLVEKYKRLIKEELAKREDSKIKEFPQDPKTQLFMAIEAVFKSWNNPRAVDYRRIFKVPANIIGTAVTIQAMVFGNMGENSGTGVLFTRDPGTGENKPVGDFLRTAQGEDVVAGIRTPQSIEEMKDTLPEVYEELLRVIPFLEKLYKNMVDIEFTVENGKLWLLQVRSGKRTGIAAFKIAFELFEEWKEELEKQELSQEKFSQEITELEKRVLELIDPYQHIGHLLFPIFDPQALKKAEEEGRLLTKAIAAGPGAGSGKVVFDKRKAIEEAGKGNKVILVREMTTPDDVGAMAVSQGILTSTGGQLCHAAVVARQMGKPSVVGASEIIIDEENKLFRVGDIEIKEGDWVSIDGFTGEVYKGEIETRESEVKQVVMGKMNPQDSEIYQQLAWILSLAERYKVLGVQTNTDKEGDANIAKSFGAQGIGLVRTEHIFVGNRIEDAWKIIFAKDEAERRDLLENILPKHIEDFTGVFGVMNGLPVTIRLLDPPLHEFLPDPKKDDYKEKLKEVMRVMGKSQEEVESKIKELHETNPMFGFRGVRLLIAYPEIAEMQTKAIIKAAIEKARGGIEVIPKIMIPLVADVEEYRYLHKIIKKTADEVLGKEGKGLNIEYKIGTMIELARAPLIADELVKAGAQFFSFGTNDLTQTTNAFSRDDAEAGVIGPYSEKGIVKESPFNILDFEAVGALLALTRGLAPGIEIGICGEIVWVKKETATKRVSILVKILLEFISSSCFNFLNYG